MGFEDHETHDLYSNVAGIMHMGEMKFKQRPREEQAEPDGEEGPDFLSSFLLIQSNMSDNCRFRALEIKIFALKVRNFIVVMFRCKECWFLLRR